MIADISAWLDSQATILHEPLPDPAKFDFEDLEAPPQASTHTLTIVIEKLIIAIAALHRAGPWYTSKSDALWHFAAGSLSRAEYDSKVSRALAKLPKRISVERDVAFAQGRTLEALMILRREGDVRDVRDLMECLNESEKAGI
ncbi:hypothetical protein LTR86_008585 [Recurvomyces mirabilis]|nr:hypothetical protein LTR86_008585 [Recurvomyces mirabilis]